MAIRQEAMSSAAFCRLREAYDNRKAVLCRWKSSGKKVVGLMGYDIPEEILLAAGLLPFRITGYYGGERASAEKYLEYSFGSIWKGLWESVTSDYEGLLERMVFCSSSDMFLKLFYYLRALGGLEPERKLPEILYLDFELTQKTFKTQERNERELRDLIAAAERWSGNTVSGEALRAAIVLCNEYRRALRAFDALRGPECCTVTGSEALTVTGGAMFMEKRAAIDCLHQVTEEAKKWPAAPGVRVYYAGSPQETTEVYGLAEQAGCNIVGEDHDMGRRMFDTDVDERLESVSALAGRLIERMPCSEKGSIRERVRALGRELDETRPDAFVTYMNNNDEAYVWDYPSVKSELLEKRGIPDTVVKKQNWPLIEPEMLRAQFAALAGQVRGAK